MRKKLVDLLKMSKILVDFLSFYEKSVEFFAPNTDWFPRKNFSDDELSGDELSIRQIIQSQFVFGDKFHRHVGGIFPTFLIIFQLSRWNFSYLFLCYH